MIKISSNCNKIILEIPTQSFFGAANLAISDNSGVVLNAQVTIPQGGLFAINYGISTTGVVSYLLTKLDGTTIAEAATVATCAVDCCLASLVERAINCTCNCDDCNTDLEKAKKILLLLQSAKYKAEVLTDIAGAASLYSKAADLCTDDCNSGC